MDEVILRTPHIAVAIFTEVDNKTLADCNIVSENWGSFIDMKKVHAIWLYKDHGKCFSTSGPYIFPKF